jgi:DNA-binding NarL/FixJ family response regulator
MQPLPFNAHFREPVTFPAASTRRVPVLHRPMLKLGVYLVGESPLSNSLMASRLEDGAAVNVIASAIDEPSAMFWLARQPAADLVIVDLFLAAGSGLGVLRRSQLTDPGRRVVVLSNFVHGELRRSCLALGAEQVFDKSTEIDSLLAYCDTLAAGLCLQ